MKFYKKAILPLGFKANAVSAGIKRNKKLDLALFYSEVPAKVAGVFTTNKIQANPVKLNKIYLKKNNSFQALIVNSGNANCFTGEKGFIDCIKITEELAKYLNLKKESILISSTGIIGRPLPLKRILKAIPSMVEGLSKEGIEKAKRAILTTDTFPKEITYQFNLGKAKVTLCGVAKGAGMIFPNLATMLCFIFTDLNITEEALNKALRYVVEDTFNCISVDGCMSTNDTVLIFANGEAKNKLVHIDTLNFKRFLRVLFDTCLYLAKCIVKDAEGATKFIQIRVKEATSKEEAKRIAFTIANSNLFKSAIYGENPNIGRIVSAIGATKTNIQERDLKIKLSPLSKKEIYLDVSLRRGKQSATVYTSDLTPKYIKINARYT